MRKVLQYAVAYKDHKDQEKMIGTFWMYEDGSVDKENTLNSEELAEMLKMSTIRDIYSYATGNMIDEDE